MMEHQIKPRSGSRRRRRRIGRGNAGGQGTYSGKGLNGQKSRSGKGPRPGFEGGQLPLIKRLPERRGFTNIFKERYSLINVGELESYIGDKPITKEMLRDLGLVKNLKHPIKILGDGDLTKAVIIQADKFSGTAKKKIEEAGGKAEEISN
ncbi:50S ribosomal protein L15 [SAR202 cluster bacterium AD-804-J14_MRT_500m]|nr:50S ribosomal protein L15 [SAR202 cluster bacterium AD-804-J14_MRT_500m]